MKIKLKNRGNGKGSTKRRVLITNIKCFSGISEEHYVNAFFDIVK